MILVTTYTNNITAKEYDFPKCPEYDTKPSDGEAPVLELCGIWSTSLLPLLSGLH